MEARGRLSEALLDRLQRSPRALPPRAGISDASGFPEELRGVHVELPFPKALWNRISPRGAALHPPALARLGGFPRHPRRTDARARPRLLRKHGSRDPDPAALRDPESEALRRLLGELLGNHGERGAGPRDSRRRRRE